MKKFEKLKRTPWFKFHVKPTRPGVYERRYLSGTILFAEWTGHNWLFGRRTPTLAATEREASFAQGPWRGLAEELKS